jgi:phosphoglycolate phosphatase
LTALRLLCLDLDGTLVDSAADIRAALAVALAAVGPADPALDGATLATAGMGLPLDEFFALARPPSHPASGAEHHARFVAAYREAYHAHLLQETRPFDGVAEALEALARHRAAGLRLAVATTKKTDTAKRVLAGLGLAERFDLILGTEDGVAHKPAPDLLFLAAARTGRAPESGMMVGDTTRDILAGRAAGMATCGVSYGATGAEPLRAAGADHVIDRFAELVPLVDRLS